MVIMEVGLSMLTPKWTLIQTMIGENSNYPSLEINPKFNPRGCVHFGSGNIWGLFVLLSRVDKFKRKLASTRETWWKIMAAQTSMHR